MIKIFKVKRTEENIRLDKWLKINFSTLTQSFIEKNIRKKNILLNNEKAISKTKLNFNDVIKICNFDVKNYKNLIIVKAKKNIPKKNLTLFNSSIIYNDSNFFILNKWSSIATQGGSKINISIDDIIKNISNSNNLVHRLDKNTSGLLIIAKNLEFTKLFGSMFKNHLIKKVYFALCEGKPKENESLITLKISKKKNDLNKFHTETYYKLLSYKDGISQIAFIPKTGKTHQLRIVSKKLGCPIIGDNIYNSSKKYISENLKLNAHILRFKIKSKNYEFFSKIPHDFIKFNVKKNLKKIREIQN